MTSDDAHTPPPVPEPARDGDPSRPAAGRPARGSAGRRSPGGAFGRSKPRQGRPSAGSAEETSGGKLRLSAPKLRWGLLAVAVGAVTAAMVTLFVTGFENDSGLEA